MRLFLCSGAALIGCCLALSSATAHTRAAEFAMQLCVSDVNVTACDDMIAKTDDTDTEFRTRAYAVRAIARIRLDDITGAGSDFAKLKAIAPDYHGLANIEQLLGDRSGPQQPQKTACLSDFALPAVRIDACTSLITANAGTARQQLEYLAARGRARFQAGDFAGAQADIQKPLQDAPGNTVFMTDNIIFTYAAGDYDAARQQAQEAMKKTAEPMQYAFLKGQMAYLLGYHSMAIHELLAARLLDPTAAEAAYWVTLLRMEDHEDASRDLLVMLDQLGPQTSLAKTAQFLLGRITADALIADAKTRPEPVRAMRLCQAYFSVGHQALLNGDKKAAALALQNALQTNEYRLMEYQASKMLLRKLDAS